MDIYWNESFVLKQRVVCDLFSCQDSIGMSFTTNALKTYASNVTAMTSGSLIAKGVFSLKTQSQHHLGCL